MSRHDIGDMTIGNTKTRIDFPYKCKKCGEYISIRERHEWQHVCIPKIRIVAKPRRYVKELREGQTSEIDVFLSKTLNLLYLATILIAGAVFLKPIAVGIVAAIALISATLYVAIKRRKEKS
jgi:hypothetical protein